MSGKIKVVQPLREWILIKRIEASSKSAGGIELPQTAQKQSHALVVAVGPGRVNEETGRCIEPRVKVGDIVITEKYAGVPVELEGVEHHLVPEQALIARLELE